jgi:hypothetical protein
MGRTYRSEKREKTAEPYHRTREKLHENTQEEKDEKMVAFWEEPKEEKTTL